MVGANRYSIELSFSFSISTSSFHLVWPKLKRDYHQHAFIPTYWLPTTHRKLSRSCRWLQTSPATQDGCKPHFGFRSWIVSLRHTPPRETGTLEAWGESSWKAVCLAAGTVVEVWCFSLHPYHLWWQGVFFPQVFMSFKAVEAGTLWGTEPMTAILWKQQWRRLLHSIPVLRSNPPSRSNVP